VILVDEASFIRDPMLLSTILPVGLNSFVATFLASTPGDANSWMMRSISLYDSETGEPLIPLLKTVEPCDMHAKTDKPWLCNCKQNKRAPWKSSAREKFWEPFWGAQGKKTFFTETYGLVLDAVGACFHSKWLERLKTRPPVEITIPPNYVYVSIDPAEGGPDEFAISVMTISRDHWVVSACALRAGRVCVCVCVCGQIFTGLCAPHFYSIT
jgi:hypothetical protein